MAKNKQTKRVMAMAMAATLSMGMAFTAFADETLPEHIPAAPAEDEVPVVDEQPIDVTIVIPSDADETVTEEFGDEVNSLDGDIPTSENDDEYDYEITVEQGSVTVETEANENGENNVEFVTGVVAPSTENDIIFEQGYFDKAESYYEENELDAEDFLPAPGNEEVTKEELGQLEIPGEDDKERFELITQGATSQFRPMGVYTKPMNDEDKFDEFGYGACIHKDELYNGINQFIANLPADVQKLVEDGVIAPDEETGYYVYTEAVGDKQAGDYLMKAETTITLDGVDYYTHRFDFAKLYKKDKNGNLVVQSNLTAGRFTDIKGAYIESVDENGNVVWVKDGKKYEGFWEEAAQFVLVDKTTGELITTYAEDYYNMKFAVGAEYYMENLEDSERFGEYADNIRAVAQAGYWGTAEGEGSLGLMKEELLASGAFTEAELESLTDGVALAATQMAIYYYTNAKFGQEFINVNYDATPETLVAQWGAAGGAVPEGKQDEAALIFKVYDYLKNLTPVDAVTKAEDIISNENFLKGEMEITVLEKAEDHENNDDEDETNDAFKTNLTFALVVTPSTENGDDLVVKVVNAKTGEAIASGRVAGTATGEETHGMLVADENGNYTFENIIMTEGDHTYNITMEGIQNLKEGGVYLFTTDVPEGTKKQPSMIGMTSDKNVVDVESVNFKFEVKDEKIVVRERHDDDDDDYVPPTTNIPEENVPMVEVPELDVPMVEVPDVDVPMVEGEELVEIEDGDVILSDVPQTSDPTAPFMGLSFLSAIGLIFAGRRRKED